MNTREIGELTVSRIDGRVVVERADPFIYVTQELLDQLAPNGDGIWHAGHVTYRIIGPSLTRAGSMICERVA